LFNGSKQNAPISINIFEMKTITKTENIVLLTKYFIWTDKG